MKTGFALSAIPALLLLSTATGKPPASLPGSGAGGSPAVRHLEMLYATSIAMPEDRFGPGRVFDNDPGTFWATMPGAAPDEGLFFSFAEPVFIGSIHTVAAPKGDSYEEIYSVIYYINGMETPVSYLLEEPFPVNTMVQSVFVKIVGTSSNSYTDQGIRYDSDLPVAVRSISLTTVGSDLREIPLRVLPPETAQGSIAASSSLTPVEAYHPDFLFDSRPEFGWADGNTGRTGSGESITFSFDSTRRIEKIKIWNGYHRSPTHFTQNERAARFTFGVQGGTPVSYTLEDSMDPQLVVLESPLEGRVFEMTFQDVHRGQTYRDLVVSEIRFFDGEGWFLLNTGGFEARKRSVLEWAAGSPAGAFIDRQLMLYEGDGEFADWQSFILRSNGSFILWKHLGMRDEPEGTYADGNWQIIDDNTVRIFGRLKRILQFGQPGYDPYAGVIPGETREQSRVTIFSDTLRFDASHISSSRGLFQDFRF